MSSERISEHGVTERVALLWRGRLPSAHVSTGIADLAEHPFEALAYVARGMREPMGVADRELAVQGEDLRKQSAKDGTAPAKGAKSG